MILNLILQDSNLYKNLTVLSYEASTSTAKEGNYIEVQIAHLKKPVRVLKIIGLLGDDEQGKDELIKQVRQILYYTEYVDEWFNSIDSFRYELNYLKLNPDTNLMYQHTIKIVKTKNKAYVKHYYKDINKKKVVVFDRYYDRNDYREYEGQYPNNYFTTPFTIMSFKEEEDWYDRHRFTFRLNNLKSEHKPFMLEFVSKILKINVIDITEQYLGGGNGSYYRIDYLASNNEIKDIKFYDLHYSNKFAVWFICSLFTTSNTLFIIHRYFDVIHPHLGQHLLNKVRNQEFYNNNQVLFNTNNAELINTQYMRADQIYFVESNPENTINLFSAQDFEGIREDVPFDKWYLAGKFGALPKL